MIAKEPPFYVCGKTKLVYMPCPENDYLRRSRDGTQLFGCLAVCQGGSVCAGIRSSLHSIRFGQLLCCAHKRIVNNFIMKVYIERSNMQVELIRFRKKYRIYSRLLLRSEEFNAARVFTLGKWLQLKPAR